MLVPTFTSFPVSQRGTVENAMPGVTMSGLASSPPRELNQPRTSRAGGTPGCGGRAKTPGNVAPTESARSADPGGKGRARASASSGMATSIPRGQTAAKASIRPVLTSTTRRKRRSAIPGTIRLLRRFRTTVRVQLLSALETARTIDERQMRKKSPVCWSPAQASPMARRIAPSSARI